MTLPYEFLETSQQCGDVELATFALQLGTYSWGETIC